MKSPETALVAFCNGGLRWIAAGNRSTWVAAAAAEVVDSRSALSKLMIVSISFGVSI